MRCVANSEKFVDEVVGHSMLLFLFSAEKFTKVSNPCAFARCGAPQEIARRIVGNYYLLLSHDLRETTRLSGNKFFDSCGHLETKQNNRFFISK